MENKKFNYFAILFAGGFAGIVNLSVSTLTHSIHPYFKSDKTSIQSILIKMIRSGGPSGLFSGFTPYILRNPSKFSKSTNLIKLESLGPIVLRAFMTHSACFLGLELAVSLLY